MWALPVHLDLWLGYRNPRLKEILNVHVEYSRIFALSMGV